MKRLLFVGVLLFTASAFANTITDLTGQTFTARWCQWAYWNCSTATDFVDGPGVDLSGFLGTFSIDANVTGITATTIVPFASSDGDILQFLPPTGYQFSMIHQGPLSTGSGPGAIGWYFHGETVPVGTQWAVTFQLSEIPPVGAPEPSTLVLLSLGLFWFRWRAR